MTKKTTLPKPTTPKLGISDKLVQTILQRVAAGETLTAICREEDMPPEASVRKRINQSSALRTSYAHAREERAERMADELLDIAEDGRNDWMEKEGRNGSFVALNEESIRRSQLRVDTRKWLLSRLLPHRFGDRVEHTGAGGGPIQHEHTLSAAMLNNLNALRARLPALPSPAPSATVIDVSPSQPAHHDTKTKGIPAP